MIEAVISMMRIEAVLAFLLLGVLCLRVWKEQISQEALLWVNGAGLLILTAIGLLHNETGTLFGNMFVSSPLISLEKAILAGGTLIVLLSASGWLRTHPNRSEFHILIISSLLGMFFMISAGSYLMLYVGLELATLPAAILAGYDTGKVQSAEAGVKMIFLSAFATATLLLGISFLYGGTGSLTFTAATSEGNPLLILGLILLFAGFAFKLSVAPFHLWTADVFEGAPVPVAAFLSVISKGAVIIIFTSTLGKVFGSSSEIWTLLLTVTATLTIITGNLFALRQRNIKRFLAFSSIAQAGYMMIGVAAGTAQGTAAVVYFLAVYILSNLGAFGVAAAVAHHTGSETLDGWRSLHKNNSFLSWVMLASVFSLAGIPPTAGFFGKFFLLAAGMREGLFVLTAVAALNLVVSLYYYLLVAKVMFIDKAEAEPGAVPLSMTARTGLIICLAGIILGGMWGGAYEYIYDLIMN